MSNWIKCSDRMPEDGQRVATLSGRNSYDAIYQENNDEFISGLCKCLGVTHWQPLPEPPKEGE
ncbi:DUF551 domain-containing protein [Erwinia sp. V71]|uniref:DUF551 domain-containing protein n=1 Tax=Erwinia sp. V71 TaxID=3369424 RepID=UPI003F5F40CD